MKLTLQHLKKNPEKRARLEGKTVLIRSNEWGAWWRPDAKGYTVNEADAGRYEFADAWARSHHCGPEKRIAYHVDRAPAQGAAALRTTTDKGEAA